MAVKEAGFIPAADAASIPAGATAQTEGHTPGPWVPNDKHSGQVVWRVEVDSVAWTNDGYIIADLWGPDAAANARLIAAAPDLLDALIALSAVAEMTTFSDQYPGECEAARAAIAKATGQ